jgi:hypothetical protein
MSSVNKFSGKVYGDGQRVRLPEVFRSYMPSNDVKPSKLASAKVNGVDLQLLKMNSRRLPSHAELRE